MTTEPNTVAYLDQALAEREAEYKVAYAAFCIAEKALRETAQAMHEAQAAFNEAAWNPRNFHTAPTLPTL